MSYRLEEAENAYNSNDIFEYNSEGLISSVGVNIIETGAISPLNMTLECPIKGGKCIIKLGADGGQNAIINLVGCLLEDSSNTIVLRDIEDEVTLYFYNESTWILGSYKGSVVIS